MLSYLVTEVVDGVRVVTVSGRSESGTFADGVVAIVTETVGAWKGRPYSALAPGWYDGHGDPIAQPLPTAVFLR